MRFVRNHIDHGVTLLDLVQLTSVGGNSRNGMRAGWSWRPLDQLGPLLDPKYKSGPGASGRKQYQDRPGGQVVGHTLLDANRWFLK